jgi:hypothetical protein
MTRKQLEDKVLVAMHKAGMITKRGTVRHNTIWWAKHVPVDALRPHIPAGTVQWAMQPSAGENAANYVARMVATAEARCAWVGGLQ